MKFLVMPNTIKQIVLLSLIIVLSACQNNAEQQTQDTVQPPHQTIHEATFMGNEKAVKQHIQAGSDLNEKDQFGSTPLTIAITFDKVEIARLLIDAGADIHATSADGSTPLHTAAFLCRIEVVEALLNKGANRDLTNSFGSTPLQSLQVPFETVKPVYDQLSRDLGPLGFKLNYDLLKENRPVVAQMLIAE